VTTLLPPEQALSGRTPPHSLEAEGSVLGAILIDPEALPRVSEFLMPEDFYRENNSQVFRAALKLFAEGEPIDVVTVAAQLEREGLLERVGGRAHLALLAQGVPTAANVEYYGRLVKEKSTKRSLITAGGKIAGFGYDEAREADDALNEAQAEVFRIADDRTTSEFQPLYPLLREAMDRIEAQMSGVKGVLGISSGFYDLDSMTNGFKPSDLVIVAGRPSMGKTSLCLNIALRAAVDDKVPVAIFSLEMSKEQLVERMLCEQARVDAQRMHKGMLSEKEHADIAEALGPLGDAPIFIDDSPVLDELSLLTKARRVAAREKIGMIVVDYLQLMHGRSRSDDFNRVQEVSAISRSMKAMARELRLPVLAISQLSRSPEQRENKRPILSDLRESGSIEQDADLVMFVFRPDYYKPEERPGIAEIIVAKHRNGPTGSVELIFRKELTRFENKVRRPEPVA
jgi:replicative DNA helicase